MKLISDIANILKQQKFWGKFQLYLTLHLIFTRLVVGIVTPRSIPPDPSCQRISPSSAQQKSCQSSLMSHPQSCLSATWLVSHRSWPQITRHFIRVMVWPWSLWWLDCWVGSRPRLRSPGCVLPWRPRIGMFISLSWLLVRLMLIYFLFFIFMLISWHMNL